MFVPYSKNLLRPRPRIEDPEDIRMAEYVRVVDNSRFESILPDLQQEHFVLWAYSDDRGVDRNGGRPGAAEAPDLIRSLLYKMTPSRRTPSNLVIWDLGNFRSWSLSLGEAHQAARKIVSSIRQKGCKIITLGGGHDWAYPDFVDFNSASFQDNLISHLVNFDAHLDMRPEPSDPERKHHSGTPFKRILEEKAVSNTFRLSVVGLGEHCNAKHHIQWALGHRVLLQFIEDLADDFSAGWDQIAQKLELNSNQKTRYGLSVDMDAFSQRDAPGVSASQCLGLNPNLVLKFLATKKSEIRQLGVYETNPRFDRDYTTCRLAARIIFEFLQEK